MASSTARHQLHTTCLIVCAWTQRSWPGGPPFTHLWRTRWWLQSLKSFPPRMSVPNFSERSWPSYKRLRFLRCLRGLRRRPTCSCCAVTPFSGTSISSPQFSPPCVQRRLKVIMWLVLNQRYFKRGSGPSDKLIVWQAHQWLSPDRKKSRPARSRHPRRRLLGLLCLTGWALLLPQRRGRSHRSRPFQLAPEGPVHGLSKEARSLASLLMLPQPRNVDGFQVGARLADFAPHWRSLLGNCRATGIVEDGVGIAFQQRPQLTHQSISFRTRNSRQDLQQAVDALLMKGAIERVTNVRSLGFYSRLFLVPKKTGDLRPVIDLSTLNRHMVVPHFKMETQGSVRSAIRSQEWAVSIDIRDAYLHVPMHQAVRKYLRFVVNKKVYQFTCLPFGLATSPREFTKLLRPVVSLLRQQGVKLHVYLDDWLIRADTPEEAQLHSQTIIKVLQFLGWIINFEKSDLTPSQDFQFIGMQFNTRRFTVAPLPKMRIKVQSVLQHWMANPNITARDLHRLLGMLVFMASLVRGGRLRLRPVQWWAATAWCQRTGNWSDRIQVPQWVLSEVAWWSSPAVLQGLPLAARETEVTLFTDASSSGWGAQLGSHSTQGQWSASQRLCHINVLEMQAVICAVRDFLPLLRYHVVRLMCDNAVTVAYIKNEGGTRSHTLMQMTIRLLKWCDSKAITLVPVHLPGVRNIQADSLSRVGQTLTTEWTMAMESLRPVFAKWGEPQIDMFATFANRRLVKFVSPYPDPRAEWTDAMSMPWDKERGLLYVFPPFKMVPQVLQKIAQSPELQVILIALLQPAASWFPELMNLTQEDPVPLFVEGQDLLTQDVCMGGGVTETRHFRPSNLHAWKLSGPFWEPRVIPGKLPTWCQDAYENLHNKCMNLIGQDSWRSVGRKNGKFFKLEVIISVPIWCTSSGTIYYPRRLKAHRTSVASVLRHWVYDPAADPNIKLLVRAFRLERPVQRRIMPKWDLHLVLLSLMRPPFTSQSEDDGESSDDVIPLKWRTLKCLFLLALASARRRSYLHALSIAPGRCVFARGNTQRQLVVSLLPEPGFLAKNQLPTQAPEWITVPGIAHLNPAEPERMLCPVRQLKLYIRDSESIRGGRQRMFLHWNRSIRDIMRSHISRWIVETVKEAYTQADRQFDRVTAHEVRALSASWAYNCQVALPDILAAAFWRSSGVFQNSYLRDMACVAEGMSTLGPVVVAQHVVDPGHLHPPP